MHVCTFSLQRKGKKLRELIFKTSEYQAKIKGNITEVIQNIHKRRNRIHQRSDPSVIGMPMS